MAGAKGLEPSIFAVTGRRVNQLHHAPVAALLRQEGIIAYAAGQGLHDRERSRYTSSNRMDIVIEFFQKLHNLDELIRWGGYAVLAIIVFAETGLLAGFFLPGDSLLVTAGLFAGTGHLDIAFLFVLLSVMAIVGDSTGYWFGSLTGPALFRKEKSILFAKHHLVRAQQFYEKHGGKTIVLARFMPIVRTFAPIVAGIARMPYGKFFAYNVFGGILWVGSMLSIGYFLGRVVPGIEEKIHLVIIVIVLLSISPGFVEYVRHRSRGSSGSSGNE